MSKKIAFLLQILILLSFSSISFAATIYLKTGKIIEADIIEETDKYIKIDFSGTPLTYYRENIESISYPPGNIPQSIIPSYAKKGIECALNEKFGEAKREFEENLKINEDSLEVRELLRTIIDLNNRVVTEVYCSYLFSGLTNIINEQYTQAIENLRQAQQICPHYPTTYLYLGLALFFSGQNEKAKEILIKTKDIFQKMGYVQRIQQIEKYLEQVEQAIASQPPFSAQ